MSKYNFNNKTQLLLTDELFPMLDVDSLSELESSGEPAKSDPVSAVESTLNPPDFMGIKGGAGADSSWHWSTIKFFISVRLK